MTVLIALALSITIGWLRGGGLKNFAQVHFKYPLIGLAGLWMQALIINTELRQWLQIGPYAGLIYSLAYLLVFLFFLLNLSISGFSLVAIGSLLNTLAISLNKGQMPLSASAAKIAGLMDLYRTAGSVPGEAWTTFVKMSPQTRLGFLADIIPLSRPFPAPTVISLGDIFILAGIFWFVQQVMVESPLVSRRS